MNTSSLSVPLSLSLARPGVGDPSVSQLNPTDDANLWRGWGKIVRTRHVSRDSSLIISRVTINTIIEFIILCNTALMTSCCWLLWGFMMGCFSRCRKLPPGPYCPGQSWHYWWSLDTWWSVSSYPIMAMSWGACSELWPRSCVIK